MDEAHDIIELPKIMMSLSIKKAIRFFEQLLNLFYNDITLDYLYE